MQLKKIRTRVSLFATAAAVAAGTVGLTAPPADAYPISEVRSGCNAAGGTFGRLYDRSNNNMWVGYYCDYRHRGWYYRELYDRHGDMHSNCRKRGRRGNWECEIN